LIVMEREGLVGQERGWYFDVERSLISDPRSEIFLAFKLYFDMAPTVGFSNFLLYETS
jgi:hypothetical protein